MALDHFLRDRVGQVGVGVEDRLERVLPDLDGDDVGDGHDVGGARLAGEQGHLADDAAGAELGDLVPAASESSGKRTETVPEWMTNIESPAAPLRSTASPRE